MGFKCGIVGLPNVGKSTLFNSLTRAGIAAENYPFCTIDPNVGVLTVFKPREEVIEEEAPEAPEAPEVEGEEASAEDEGSGGEAAGDEPKDEE